jgi:3',5'-nucleoside bisphosphate phosphatase
MTQIQLPNKMKIYFGHAVSLYNTPIESSLEEVIATEFSEFVVENPNQKHHDEGYFRCAKSGRGMDYYFNEVLPNMGAGIFLPFDDGMFGKGVYGEAEFLRDANKPIYEIDKESKIKPMLLDEKRCLSINDTRKRIRATDMHIHTTYSDGKDGVDEILVKSKEKGLSLISITDHDSIAGLKEANELATKMGLSFINGIELSVTYHTPFYKNGKEGIELHMLGYDFDLDNQNLVYELEENQKYRVIRARKMLKKLNERLESEGVPIISEEEYSVIENSAKSSIGRPHFIDFLFDRGVISSNEEAFDTYLNNCNLPKRKIFFEKGSEIIRNAGGKVVLAHPVGSPIYSLLKISKDFNIQKQVIESMRPYLDGIEVFYRGHNSSKIKQFSSLAQDLGMIATGGSDHHGGKGRDCIGKVTMPLYVQNSFKK